MDEKQWDQLLKIRTSGRDDSRSDSFRYPYEPTPYCVLERLANSGWIGKQDVLAEIIGSSYEAAREILLFFYYPSDEYVSELMMTDELEFCDDIECGDLFPGEDPREKILIFRIG